MPSPRIIITILAAIAGLIAFLVARGHYPTGNWPLGYCMGAFIVVYVLGNIVWGVMQGVREAQAAARQQDPTKPKQ